MATKVTARRGASDRAPENTLAAIRQAVESGADRIEVDVHASRDGRLVLHHFYVLGETDDGEGLVFERDAAYLRALDVGSWFDPVYRGACIPFLEEVFAAMGDAVEYELDLKGFTLPFLDAVLALTHRFGVFDRTEFTSPHLFLLAHLRRREPRGRVGLFAYTLVEPWMTPDLGWTLLPPDGRPGRHRCRALYGRPAHAGIGGRSSRRWPRCLCGQLRHRGGPTPRL